MRIFLFVGVVNDDFCVIGDVVDGIIGLHGENVVSHGRCLEHEDVRA